MSTMRVLAGDPYMHDPSLLGRLGEISIPMLVLWGESDRIVTPDYGRAIAAPIPEAHFEIIREAGHLPHIEQPAATFRAIDGFLAATSASSSTGRVANGAPGFAMNARWPSGQCSHGQYHRALSSTEEAA
jgi:hypothetical protein